MLSGMKMSILLYYKMLWFLYESKMTLNDLCDITVGVREQK